MMKIRSFTQRTARDAGIMPFEEWRIGKHIFNPAAAVQCRADRIRPDSKECKKVFQSYLHKCKGSRDVAAAAKAAAAGSSSGALCAVVQLLPH